MPPPPTCALSYKAIELALPKEMVDGVELFKEFYEAENKHRWGLCGGASVCAGTLHARSVCLLRLRSWTAGGACNRWCQPAHLLLLALSSCCLPSQAADLDLLSGHLHGQGQL